jgi:hypothetical protein
VYLFFEIGPKLEKSVASLVAAIRGVTDAISSKDEVLAAIKAAHDRIDQLDTQTPKGQ